MALNSLLRAVHRKTRIAAKNTTGGKSRENGVPPAARAPDHRYCQNPVPALQALSQSSRREEYLYSIAAAEQRGLAGLLEEEFMKGSWELSVVSFIMDFRMKLNQPPGQDTVKWMAAPAKLRAGNQYNKHPTLA
jgi:hypothetical protein